MSEIDQAFIHAYAPEAAGAAPTVPFAPINFSPTNAAENISDPHFRLHGRVPSVQHNTPGNTVAAPREPLARHVAAPVVDPTGERRPLSSFTSQGPSPAFRPVYEVDTFLWPEITEHLIVGQHEQLLPVVEQLLVASEEGRSMVGIAGVQSGVGSTTVQICLGRLLAAMGKSVAMVDGNFSSRSLGRQLGLEFEAGWEQALTSQLPLAECMVQATEDDCIALLPLSGHSGSAAELLNGIQTSVTAGVLRYHYDIVLFDLGAAAAEPQHSAARAMVDQCRIDASILVADATVDEPAALESVDRLMSFLGPTCLGLIGNQSDNNPDFLPPRR